MCWPPGTQQIAEVCGTQESGDCAAGLVCIGDEGEEPNVIAHCYRAEAMRTFRLDRVVEMRSEE